MNKTAIIIEREFFVRIRKKSFIILTVLMPLLIAGLIFVPIFLANINSSEKLKIAVVDQTGKYQQLLKDSGNMQFVPVSKMDKNLRAEESPYNAVIYIAKDLNMDSTAATIYSRKEVPVEVKNYFNNVVSEKIREDRMMKYNIPNLKKIVNSCKVDYSVRTVKWTKDGEEKVSNSDVASVIGIIFTLVIYMFVLGYGSLVMQGVMEEKTNRIMELMVSSVKSFQLMLGKIIGVALVGLFQFIVWGVMVAIILAVAGSMTGVSDVGAQVVTSSMANGVQMTASGAGDILQIISGMNMMEICIMFILYFIGGYFLYSSFFAAVGASVNEAGDAQQFMMPVTLLLIFALYAGMFSAQNPDGPLAMWCSYIPFTSPVVMMIRLPFGVPAWQLVLSLGILFISAIAVIWVSAKIYRIGILMYGKKPTLSDLLKWIKFK